MIEEVKTTTLQDNEPIERTYTLSPSTSTDVPILFAEDNISRYKKKDEAKLKLDMEKLSSFRRECIESDKAGKYDNIIGKRLKHLIEIRKTTQLELAEQSNVDRTSIHRYLTGSIPYVQTLKKLLDALDCDIDTFVYDPAASYEDWEDFCDRDYRLRIDWSDDSNSCMKYSALRDIILAFSKHHLLDDNQKRIPEEYRLMFQQQLCFACDTMDMIVSQLQKHEKEISELHQKYKSFSIR